MESCSVFFLFFLSLFSVIFSGNGGLVAVLESTGGEKKGVPLYPFAGCGGDDGVIPSPQLRRALAQPRLIPLQL